MIGNAAYKAGPLANPVNDATAVAEALEKQLGFDKVILRKDLAFDGFRRALAEIAQEASGAALAVLYFAGHGMEVNGKNYLIPVDAKLAQPAALGLEAIALDLVLEQLAGATRLKLVILDACRDNPFPAAKRGGRGLKRVEPEDNTLVVYAAKDGTTADDGVGRRHSPFTAALLKHIATPGLEVSFVFRRVRDDVVAATKGLQTPHTYGTLGGKELYLKPLAAVSALLPQGQPSEAAEAWAVVKDSAIVAQIEAIVRRFPGTVYADFATARIDALRKQQAALAAPLPKAPEPVVAALDPKRAPVPLTAVEERALKPKDSFKECPDCPEMMVVPAGSFMMGSSAAEIATLKKEYNDNWFENEGPQHQVAIRRPFAVGKFEVTFAEWDACVAGGGCGRRPKDEGWGRGMRPVINVSWSDVTQQYLPWLSRKTGKTYRLLTEAEWEYAARAGAGTRFHFGNTEHDLCAYANAGDLTAKEKFPDWTAANCRDGYATTAPVGSFRPNTFGLFDMHGNVWEWVQDCWNGSYNGAPSDGSAWTTGDCSRPVLRGGSWVNVPAGIRAAYRNGLTTYSGYEFVGFRVGRTL